MATITSLPTANTIDGSADYLAIDTASLNTTQKINRNTFLGLSSAPLGLTDTQSPTNKTFNNTNAYTTKDGSFTLQNSSSVTKQATFSLSGITAGQTRVMTLPDYNAALASLAGTETFTNKTLTSPTINSPTITNATISADAITGYSVSNTGTIYGISVSTANVSMSGTLGVTGATTLSSTLAVTGATTLSSTLGTTGQLSVQTGTAPPAAGATTSGIKVSSTANFGIFWGSGAPTFSAAKGSVYMRTDGSSTSTRMYINTDASTTWTNVTTAA